MLDELDSCLREPDWSRYQRLPYHVVHRRRDRWRQLPILLGKSIEEQLQLSGHLRCFRRKDRSQALADFVADRAAM